MSYDDMGGEERELDDGFLDEPLEDEEFGLGVEEKEDDEEFERDRN